VKKAFTLFELLVVIAIMAILGAVAMAGYRAMERGVTERAALRAMNQFIRAAYHRAQIDHIPVAIFHWNETLQEESGLAPPIVVGKAVAVRRSGRVTKVTDTYIYDEFGDLQFFNSSYASSEESTMWIYKMNGSEGGAAKRSRITRDTYGGGEGQLTLRGADAVDRDPLQDYCYKFADKNGVDWRIGDAYGLEFLDITLPHNFLIGEEFSSSVSSPIRGEGVIRFKVSANTGSGARDGTDGKSTVEIYSLRPDKQGKPKAFKAGETEKPTEKMTKK